MSHKQMVTKSGEPLLKPEILETYAGPTRLMRTHEEMSTSSSDIHGRALSGIIKQILSGSQGTPGVGA
jgi:hypothetical protein